MRHFILQICTFLGMFLCSTNVFAKCDLFFRGVNTNQSIVVDADTIHKMAQTKMLSFNVENTGTSDCYYFVTMNEGMSGDILYNRQAKITHALPVVFHQANNESILYQLYSHSVIDSNIIKSLDQAMFVQNVVGVRKINAGQTMTESFLLHVPAQRLPNLIAESYDDDVVLTLYQSPDDLIDFANDCPLCFEEDNISLNLQFPITDYVTLSLGRGYNPNTHQSFLDFGELESNEKESFSIYVGGRSGSGNACSVTIRSEKGSKLVRKDVVGEATINDEVYYTVQAEPEMGDPLVSTNIDVSIPLKPVILATASEPFICGTNAQGMMGINVFITIGDVDGKTTGIYHDTITVEAMIGL